MADVAKNLTPGDLHRLGFYRQVHMATVACLCLVPPGMGIGYPAVTLEILEDKTEPFYLSLKEAAWFASINAIFSPVGGLLGAWVLDIIGRKLTVCLINCFNVLSWLLMRFSKYDNRDITCVQMMIARIITGIALGLCSAPVRVYSAEICHPSIRGRLILGSSIATALGIFLIYTFGYIFRDEWRLIALIAGSFSVFALIADLKIPESPVWLESKGRTDESRIAFMYFQGIRTSDTSHNDEFEAEYKKMQITVALGQGVNKQSFMKAIREPDVYKPLLIMIGFFACQQVSGLFIVIVYAVEIAKEAGVTMDRYLCAMLLGFVRLLATIALCFVLDRWGRRQAAIFSAIGMSACMFALSFIVLSTEARDMHLPAIFLCLYMLFSTFGLLTLPFSMIGEMYPQRVRGQAAGVAIAANYLMSFCGLQLYAAFVGGLEKERFFQIFGVTSLLSALYIYCFLPETKGKTLHEISEGFKKKSKTQK